MTYRYFQKYPLTVFSLDEYKTGQVLPNLTVRSKFLSNVVTNASLYDEYDIVDGETPETTASKFYGDAGLHWIILQSNDILDPRFGWPLSPFDLKKYAEGKYNNINAVHHYEDSGGNIITSANVIVTSTTTIPTAMIVGDTLHNRTNDGVGVIVQKQIGDSPGLPSNITIRVTSGGFITGDEIGEGDPDVQTFNSDGVPAPQEPGFTIGSTEVTNGIAVTNILYEDNENEKKRRIKILNVDLIPDIISEFESLMKK